MGTHYTTGRFSILVCQDAYDGYVGAATRPRLDAVPRAKTPMDNPMVKTPPRLAKSTGLQVLKRAPRVGVHQGSVLDLEGLTYPFLIQKVLAERMAGDLTREGVKKALDAMVWDFRGMVWDKEVLLQVPYHPHAADL